jgi:glycosyltransferase involved in cell wall biosynthesis
VRAIRRTLAEIQPDIVHAQGTERECAIGAALSPYPRVLTIHGNLRLIRKLLKPRPWSALAIQSGIEGFAVPRFDGVVCISNYTRRAVEAEARRTWVVPNAVDLAFLSLGDERENIIQNSESIPQPRDQNPTILVVANVDARKNQIAFLQALDPLAARESFAVKFFGRCGDDDYGREFRTLVDTRPWASYGGMIPRDALREEFRAAFALALPSHEDNCPMVVLEAQAAGLPVMASNVGGVPDLVEDGVTGLLIDPNSAANMRDAIEKLLTDPSLASRLVANGRRQAVERFAPAVIAQRHLSVYQEILGHAGSERT